MLHPRALALLLILVTSCGGEPAEMIPQDASVPTIDAPVLVGRPTRLSQTGLYRDFAARIVADDLMAFTPTYALWSDGLVKKRWMRLPPGTSIDKSDNDHWVFPVGTQFFKEFAKNGVRLETRLIERTGTGPDDFWMGSFAWRDDDSDADYVPDGQTELRGTDQDAPSTIRCGTCHNGEPGRILGFSAVQLGATAPGPPAVAAALGYLHGNCGHCHNPHGAARPDTDMMLRLNVGDTTPEMTLTYKTTIGVATQYYRDPLRMVRIVAGNPDGSALLFRMMQRGDPRQMPPIATKHTDDSHVEVVRDWIQNLPPQ